MYNVADLLVFCCLFTAGYFFGYYCNYCYVYGNVWFHWYAFLGVIATFILASLWTLQKHKQRQYCFNHFYMLLYGLICFGISACFMLKDNLDISFFFGFFGLCAIFVPSNSYLSLSSSSKQRSRPVNIALGNALFYAGLTTGFGIFNEFKPQVAGWTYLGITLSVIGGCVINEILQYTGWQDYKKSADLLFNLMNDEKAIFMSTSDLYATFADRQEFYFTKNRQWLVVGCAGLIVLETTLLYSPSYLQLAWSSTFAHLGSQYLYGAFLSYTLGCFVGTILMTRYKPKSMYLMFGLIKITSIAAILGIYNEELVENCFYFICFYYISMGVYSSIALQMILECSPFLYTEFILSLAFVMRLSFLEILKYEFRADEIWSVLLGLGLGSMVLTLICIAIVHFLLPSSEGLIEMRNHLLGIRRVKSPAVPQTKIWNANYFLHNDLDPRNLSDVKFDGDRLFKQYPPQECKKSRLSKLAIIGF